jgi:hypothetical protein
MMEVLQTLFTRFVADSSPSLARASLQHQSVVHLTWSSAYQVSSSPENHGAIEALLQ